MKKKFGLTKFCSVWQNLEFCQTNVWQNSGVFRQHCDRNRSLFSCYSGSVVRVAPGLQIRRAVRGATAFLFKLDNWKNSNPRNCPGRHCRANWILASVRRPRTLISIWNSVSCVRGLLSPASLNMRARTTLPRGRAVTPYICIKWPIINQHPPLM